MSAAAAPARATALTGAALRAVWFGLVPALLTGVVMRYLLVTPVRAPAVGTLHDVSEWADTHQVQAAVVLFLVFSALVRYWRWQLPAAAQWAEPVRKAQSGKLSALTWIGLLGLAAGAAILLRGSFFQSYRVLSGSMLPTLEPFELVISNQSAYGMRLPGGKGSFKPPARGDVIVFKYPPIRPDVPEELVKRVIGLPGDTILTRGGYAFINDWRVPTCEVGTYVYVSGDGLLEAHMRMEFLEDRAYLTAHGPWQPDEREPYLVKPGEVFLLGDNRNNSSDSRAWNDGRGGGLPFEKIGGRVDRVLIGRHRDGSWDFARFFQPLSRLEPHLEGIDDRDLRAGIEHCLQHRPKDTRPPAPGTQQVAP